MDPRMYHQQAAYGSQSNEQSSSNRPAEPETGGSVQPASPDRAKLRKKSLQTSPSSHHSYYSGSTVVVSRTGDTSPPGPKTPDSEALNRPAVLRKKNLHSKASATSSQASPVPSAESWQERSPSVPWSPVDASSASPLGSGYMSHPQHQPYHSRAQGPDYVSSMRQPMSGSPQITSPRSRSDHGPSTPQQQSSEDHYAQQYHATELGGATSASPRSAFGHSPQQQPTISRNIELQTYPTRVRLNPSLCITLGDSSHRQLIITEQPQEEVHGPVGAIDPSSIPHQIEHNYKEPQLLIEKISPANHVDKLLEEATGIGYIHEPRRRTGRVQQSGHRNINFSNGFQFLSQPHFHQKRTDGDKSSSNRYRDPQGRIGMFKGQNIDRYNSLYDGSLVPLMVQSTNDVYRDGGTHGWKRTFIRNVSPVQLRIANWPYQTIPPERDQWSSSETAIFYVRWVPACIALSLMLVWPRRIKGTLENFGNYPHFPYRSWRYPKLSKNAVEDRQLGAQRPQNQEGALIAHPEYKREGLLRPQYLCFLTPGGKFKVSVMENDYWNAQPENKEDQNPPYVFIAYTQEQFGSPKEARELLWEIGKLAAESEGLKAFWVGCSCFPDKETLEESVHQINDIIRGASRLVIALKQTRPEQQIGDLRQQWGDRKWTLPEALLSPNSDAIKECITYADRRSLKLTDISKKDVPLLYWSDPQVSRQLVDHYLNNLRLSRLELVTLAIRCLENRSTKKKYSDGDDSHILMGLLRRRPKPVRNDTKFEAFARLSLPQDSDRLLERMVCLCPKAMDGEWLIATDAWGANLWDIEPLCQVAALHFDDTVILDGCYMAAIKWDRFQRVAYVTGESFRRWVAQKLLRITPLLLIIGVFLVLTGLSAFAGAILLLATIPTLILSPYLLRVVYGGKLWATQALLFGFEGYMDIATIEAHIFGYEDKRLRWSPYGSTLSRHSSVESVGSSEREGECEFEGKDPYSDEKVKAFIDAAQRSPMGEQKVFTIVDTNTMMVTLIAAVHPPVTLLVCGKEGGMLRAALCSYDWATGTLYRESVMRVETPALGRMNRCPRVRFGFKRPPHAQGRELMQPRRAHGQIPGYQGPMG